MRDVYRSPEEGKGNMRGKDMGAATEGGGRGNHGGKLACREGKREGRKISWRVKKR